MKRFREAMQFIYKKHFRTSPVFDLFMRGGTLFFALAKQKKKTPVANPDGYVLFSADEKLGSAIENKLGKKVIRFDNYDENILISQSFSGLSRPEVVFDNDLLSFSEIIAIMDRNRKKKFTYKIKPAGSNYIIGSNSSNDRGSVVVIN